MTGFDSKRNAAKAKMDDDNDTQVYADTLLIVYQRGFADGKKAAQPEPVACRFCHSKKGCWAWQCYNCGEIVSRCQTLPRFAKLEQLFGSKVSNDFVLSDIICTVETKLKEKQND